MTATPSHISCAVVGARGYSGLALVEALLDHPFAKPTHAFASKSFDLAAEVEGSAHILVQGEESVTEAPVDLFFLATPPEVSLKLVPELLRKKKKVIDLSGAFRLKKHSIPDWYPLEQVDANLLGKAHYGLSPFAAPCPKDFFVTNPGCYATAVQMALIPLLKEGLIETKGLVVDAKSGASGAGRKAQEGLLFTEVTEDIRPYRIGKHQHLPEIREGLESFSGKSADLFFATQLLPVKTGIQAAIYGNAPEGLEISEEILDQAFAKAFKDYPLAKWGSLEKRPQLAMLSKVAGTPETRISYQIQGSKIYLFSCIDNLMKGAATQAIENMNRCFDWPVTTGLMKGGPR